jgi:hypothetical protein
VTDVVKHLARYGQVNEELKTENGKLKRKTEDHPAASL